ncbi:phage holin family protein [Cutibacterium avidum]|uniref:phage holin family protein n=1 Tax=Cutibacterium avidum TaxID=33010 RepID=UPI0023AA3AB6|nr:phage holin family protein [Cutibacterium avidum]MDK7699070.1 phage holin family protein [Cutibacterium avidum]
MLRTAVIFFYLSNEGISLLENATRLGLPIPAQMHEALDAVANQAGRRPPLNPPKPLLRRSTADEELEHPRGRHRPHHEQALHHRTLRQADRQGNHPPQRG